MLYKAMSACKGDCGGSAAVHPTKPTHKTSFPLCQPQQLARKHQAQFARCDTCHIAPSGLFLPAPAVEPVAAAVVAAAAAAAVLQAEVLAAVSAVE